MGDTIEMLHRVLVYLTKNNINGIVHVQRPVNIWVTLYFIKRKISKRKKILSLYWKTIMTLVSWAFVCMCVFVLCVCCQQIALQTVTSWWILADWKQLTLWCKLAGTLLKGWGFLQLEECFWKETDAGWSI